MVDEGGRGGAGRGRKERDGGVGECGERRRRRGRWIETQVDVRGESSGWEWVMGNNNKSQTVDGAERERNVVQERVIVSWRAPLRKGGETGIESVSAVARRQAGRGDTGWAVAVESRRRATTERAGGVCVSVCGKGWDGGRV